MPGRGRGRGHRRERWRSTRWVAVWVVGALGVTAATGIGSSSAAPSVGAPTQQSFNLGRGQAAAQGIKVDPRAAGLSLGITLTESLAGHQNTVAAAESRAINLGLIGTTLGAERCDGGEPTLPPDQQPQSLRRDSTEPDAAGGVHEQESVPPGTPIDKYVRATIEPFAESITTGAPLPIPGVATIAGVVTNATSGIVNGDTRRARATTDIGSLDLAGGAVSIAGMHWEATHRTGAVDESVGSFTIGSLTIGGTPVPVQDPTAALAQANTVLAPLGLELRPPVAHVEQTAAGSVLFVDPLAVAVVPNAQRDALTGGLLVGLQPVREALFDALLELNCSNATFITVMDVVIGSLTGAASFALNLGGVQTSTAAINAFQGLGRGGAGRLGGAPVSAGAPASLGSGSAGSAGPSAPSRGTSSVAAAPAAPAAAAVPAAAAPTNATFEIVETGLPLTGEKGGAMLSVGLAGLVALAVAAELDRRKMRRAQREIRLEV